MKTLKKMLAVFLVIIMLLSSAPLQGFTGLEGIFSTKAEAAVGLSGYYADAAAQWAKNNVGKNISPILGKGYWNNGGDCANFVSQCLYMGGMDMESLWNISGYYCHWTTSGYDKAKYGGSWIRVDQLYNYLVAKGATVIKNPSASQVSIGDVIIYAASRESDKTHSAIVTDIVNGVPKIAYHSTGSEHGHTTNWHLNFKGDLTFLMKLNGKKCKGGTVKTIDVYTTPKNKYPYLYNAPNGSTISQYLYDTEYGQPEYTHVYQTKTVNNVKWGYTFRYGKWGWIKLSQFTKQGTFSTTSNHSFGGWNTTKSPTCTATGERQRSCSKCGYTQKEALAKVDHKWLNANCTQPKRCSVCNATSGTELGHDYPSYWTTKTDSKCVEKGVQIKVCRRCGDTLSSSIAEKGHSMGEWYVVKNSTCTEEGLKRRDCQRTGCAYYETESIPLCPHTYGDEIIVREPDCVTDGLKKRVCIHCGNEKIYNYGEPLGHDMGEWYVETPATDDNPGVERSDCSRCDYHETRLIAEHDHEYGEWTVDTAPTCTTNGFRHRICSICLYKQSETLVATGHKVNVVEFGSYPQSKVEDKALISELNALLEDEELISYEYYYGNDEIGSMQQGDYMKYADVELDGERYRYVDIVKARPLTTIANVDNEIHIEADVTIADEFDLYTHSMYSYQRYNNYLPYNISGEISLLGLDVKVHESSDKYWFRYEPIEWRVLNQDTGLVLCETIIDAQPYAATIYANFDETEYFCDEDLTTSVTDYSESNIREWLNSEFYLTAFSEEEQGLILTSDVDGKKDKIYVLSADELTDANNYFDASAENAVSRIAVSSDYAQCQGVLANTTAEDYRIKLKLTTGYDVELVVCGYEEMPEEMLNCWWTRTESDMDIGCVRIVNGRGSLVEDSEYTYDYVIDQGIGVRPAMRLDCIEIVRNDKAPTCTEEGYVGDEFCYVCGELISTGHAVDALGHDFIISKNIAPTCLEKGLVEEECTRCGLTQIIDEPDALGHLMGNWYNVKEATCVEEGIKRRDCLREGCEYYEEEIIPIIPHTPVTIEGYDATCEDDGLTDGEICDFCGTVLVEQQTIDALGHTGLDENGNKVWIRVLDPICSTPGREEVHCTRIINGEKCDHFLEDKEIPALEPLYYESFRKDSTCAEIGYAEYTCIYCNGTVDGHKFGRILDPVEHTMGEWYTVIEAHCVYTGLIRSDCEVCDYYDEQVTDAPFSEHNLITITVNSTCVEGGHEYKECTRCDYKEGYTDLNPTGHNPVLVPEKSYAPTCTEDGLDFYECINSGCDYTSEIVIPALEHDWVFVSSVDPTCTESGYDTYECQRDGCDAVDMINTEDALGHNDGQWIITDKADCTTDGEKELLCTRDNNGETCNAHIETVHIFMREHNWSDWSVTEGTCEEDGLEKRECLNEETDEYDECTASEQNVLPAINHKWDNGVINPESTCKLHGTKTYTCQNDNSHTYTEAVELNPDNHVGETYIKDEKSATCTEDGYTGDTYCSDCDALLEKGETIPATNHDWDKWETVTPATCEGNGLEKRICKNDVSHTEENVLPAINHKWDNGVINPESTCKLHGTKTYTCQNDNSHTYTEAVELNPDNHVGETYIKDEKSATCTEDGYTGDIYCSDCDALLEKGEAIPATKHDWDKWVTVTPATCEEDGLEKRICKNDASHVEENVLPAINHKWDNGVINPESTCKLHGTKTYTCQNDNSHTYTEAVELNPDNHVGETYIKDEKSATCTEDGYTGDTYCSDCDALLEKGEAIPATKHDWDKWVTVTPATCEEDGLEKRTCKNDVSHTEENVLPATEHDWGEWETVTEPTYDCVGEKKQTCKNDSTHINTEIIPVLTRPSDNNENIETEKTVDYDKLTGEALIRLLASSKGEKITTKSRIPLDIVLVLDQSGSMSPENGNLIAKLKDAVDKFTVAIHKDAIDNEIDHRIAMVGFAMQNQYNFGNEFYQYLNTEILTTGGDPIRYSSLSSDEMNKVYKNSLVYVDVDGLVNPVLTTAKNNIDAKGATAADLGLDMACKIFSQNENDGSRKRIVVFMTDGVPTYKSDYMAETAENAISKAELLKDTFDADIYSVGVLSGSGASQAKTFLRNVCSEDQDKNELYFDCTEPEELVESFEKIAEDSTEIVTDFDDITLVDTVSSAFTLTYVQEQKLRLDAIEKLGVKNEDIAVTRYDDGTTEIEIKHITPKKVENGSDINFVVDFSFNVTANENALVSDSYVTNTDNAGIVVGVKDVYENNFMAPSDTVEEAEGVIYFNVNGITYHVVRVHAGEKVNQPEINLEGGYTFSGWDIPDEITFDGGKYTVDAILSQAEYTVTWILDGETLTETYHCGDFITPPDVGLNSTGDIFLKWNKEVPTVMPAENLTFTAVYGEHTHNYTETVQKKASCGVEGVAEFTCLCGDRYTEVIDALTHKWATRTTSSEANQTAFSSVYCVNCGDSPDENLSYTIKGKSGWSSVEYDLKLVDAENISIQPDGTITVSLPIPAEMKNARDVKIYREEADGSLTELTSTKSGSYITFTTDHFSKYIIKATYECNETGNHSDSNCDKLCDICGVEYADLGHSYTAKVTAPTCTSKGYTTYTCTKCGDSYKADETPVSEHNYKSAVTAPTCTSKGFTTYTCKACGNSYKADEKAALGHNLGSYIVVKSATCTENGSEKASCSRCTYSETRTIKATDHDYKDGICTKCGSDKSKNCSCNCHKGGISGFFFKLILFFQKIFKTNKVCKCGKAHY